MNNFFKNYNWLRCWCYGLLLTLSFAPIHLPAFAIISLALFYRELNQHNLSNPFTCGFFYGLGLFLLGISWIFVSIHNYGHLHSLTSGLITLIFISYLALFPACMASIYVYCNYTKNSLRSIIIFAALWIISEYLRSICFTGFPWLLIGCGQFDAPTKYLLPIIGVYGTGFITCIIAGFLAMVIEKSCYKLKSLYLISCLLLLFMPLLLQKKIIASHNQALSVAVIQANISMRDKWDERLFWELLQYYRDKIEILLGTQLIILPESAIPVPMTYISDILKDLHKHALQSGSTILLGIPKPTNFDDNLYYNALISLGNGNGMYLKQHIVPFGEYIPRHLRWLSQKLHIPDSNLQSGDKKQYPIKVQYNIPIASLICYEVAYNELLRKQLPQAQFIVAISDDGWFGHSFATYQQLQMSQVLSFQSSRYQIVANNDGLSSIINANGKIIAKLPAFVAGILKAKIIPLSNTTIWIKFGDKPILLLMMFIIVWNLYKYKSKPFSLLLLVVSGVILINIFTN